MRKFLPVLLFFFFFFNVNSFAELNLNIDDNQVNQQAIQNYYQQVQQIKQNQGLMPINTGQDFGMPSTSFADPEYVAQLKMTQSMITSYNWIALNSPKFKEGCTQDNQKLMDELAVVIQQSQEVSTVCQRFTEEANLCNTELFCSMFEKGNLPIPVQSRSAMKKAGYDPDSMKATDITIEMAIKVCLAQNETEISFRKQALEQVKQSIKQQIPAFRQGCEQMKKYSTPDIRLPTINPMQQVQITRQNNPNNQMLPMQQNQPIGGCQSQPPDCYPKPAPFCQNGQWVCPEGNQQQLPQIPQQQQAEPLPQENPQTTEPQLPQTPVTEQKPVTEIPSTETVPQAENTVQQEVTETISTVQKRFLNFIITGFSVSTMGQNQQAVCGNGLCEPDMGESFENCQKDCMQNAGKNVNFNQPIPTQQQIEQAVGQAGGMGISGGQVVVNQVVSNGQMQNQQQQGGNMPGLSPQALCEMTDEEIVESYSSPMGSSVPSQEEMEYRCRVDAGRMIEEINSYKLEIARCRADAALDCESKRAAAENCIKMADNPRKASEMVVINMCRQFTTANELMEKNDLIMVSNKWYEKDPALANQLGDTAQKTVEDQKNLDTMSYFFGNGEYGKKLSERAKKLIEVKERLQSKGINDQETIGILDSQIKELETESQKFINPFDITRIGYLFRPKN